MVTMRGNLILKSFHKKAKSPKYPCRALSIDPPSFSLCWTSLLTFSFLPCGFCIANNISHLVVYLIWSCDRLQLSADIVVLFGTIPQYNATVVIEYLILLSSCSTNNCTISHLVLSKTPWITSVVHLRTECITSVVLSRTECITSVMLSRTGCINFVVCENVH